MATGSYAHEERLKIARSLADEFLAEISEAQDRLSDEILADEFLADTVEAHDRLRNEIARAVDEFLAEIVKGSAALHKSLGGNETNIRFPLDFIRKRC